MLNEPISKNSITTLAIVDDENKSDLYIYGELWPKPRSKYCYYHIKVRTLQVKVYLIVPNYNYSTPLISMNILDHIIFYNPNIINPYIKLLPDFQEKHAKYEHKKYYEIS